MVRSGGVIGNVSDSTSVPRGRGRRRSRARVRHDRTEVADEFADVDPPVRARQREAVVVARPVDARAPEVGERSVGPLAEHVNDVGALTGAIVVRRAAKYWSACTDAAA